MAKPKKTLQFNTLASELSDKLRSTRPGDEDPSVKRHHERGKKTAAERIESLLDLGSPFLEVAPLAGQDLYEGIRAGGGIIAGIGTVSETPVMIVANDATVKGGTYLPITVKKHLRAQQIALENRLPCIYLVDSGGAYLPLQADVFPDREHFGRIFFNQARMSAEGIPQISVVMGSCTAGGAYVPAMSDYTIIVRGQGTIFLGGPPLVKAATGVEISAEELGGAVLHTEQSGVADQIAEDDSDALKRTRSYLKALHLGGKRRRPDRSPLPPHRSPDQISNLIPDNPKEPLPIREILSCLLDDSHLQEFKPAYGSTLICGFAHIEGYKVGLIANDGILFSESAQKAAHFIQICDQLEIPLVFFQNIVGFMIGKEYEEGGIAKHGAQLVRAVACCRVPKYTVVVGGSFGAGNYAMAGRAYDPRFLFLWPNAQVAVMGPKQAASVLTQVRSDAFEAKGKKWKKEEQEAYHEEIFSTYEQQAKSYYSTARLWDDGIITPAQTREVLALAIALDSGGTETPPSFGVFRL